MSDGFNPPKEIDLSQLVSDVSHALNGFKNLLIPAAPEAASMPAAVHDTPSLSGSASSIFSGNVCFKACGMEDIQLAAQRAADLFVTLRVCTVILTVFITLCVILLSITLGWCLFRTTLTFNGDSAMLSKTSIFNQFHPQKAQSPPPS